ncbi:MAG TPA: interleukin-like EMT inducer domain-containing protein, partial [Anaerolineae bacterium]|nr:interleukin-like EMT inducer domain-containing protein [Anaerolineae bacterium]
SDANTLFLGYGILALALLGYIVRRKEAGVWLWAALIFVILSLGPLLTINGQNYFNLDGLEVTFPMPFALLHYLPLINANRVPNRFGIPLTLALAVLVGYAVSSVMVQVSRVKWSVTPRLSNFLFLISFSLLLVLLLLDQYSVPLPLSDARIPEVYQQIGSEPDNFTVMQLPLGWRNSYGTLGAEQTQLQYYQSAHHRPMLGGNTSRNPAFKFDYYANIPLFKALTETELYRQVDETTLQHAQLQAAELMTLYNIKYLVIHEPVPQRKPYEDTFVATRRTALDLIPHQPEPIYQSPGVQVFAVQPADIPNPLTLDFGDWSSDPYRGEGWAVNEEIFAATANWATATEAVIFFPVHGTGDRHLSIQIAPFSYLGAPEQKVSLSLNGHGLADSFSLGEGWQTLEAILPEAFLAEGLNRLSLHFSHTAQPRQALPATLTIGQTGVETPLDFEVNSGSDFAFISVGFGPEAVDASAHRRGVNIAVVQPQSGQVTAVKGFDTAANEFEAAALSQFIAEIPAGRVVIVATQGLEATTFFNADTLASLQSLGLMTKALTPPFAAIGVKGAAAGTALQAVGDAHGTAYLRVGLSPDTRRLAAAVDKVVIARP